MAQNRAERGGAGGSRGRGLVIPSVRSPGMEIRVLSSNTTSASTMQPGVGPFPSLCLCHLTCTRVGLEFMTAKGSSTDYTNIN